MKAWVITPFHRLEDLDNLINNFANQEYQNKTLIVVENGECVGKFKCTKPIDYEVLTIEGSCTAAKARNAALDYIKDKEGFWSNADADDYYDVQYLEYVADAIEKNPNALIGQRQHWTKTKTMGTFLFGGPLETYLHGATLASKHTDIRYPDIAVGEDHAFVDSFIKKGREIKYISPENYIWIRNNNGKGHTFRESDYHIWWANLENPDNQTILPDYDE